MKDNCKSCGRNMNIRGKTGLCDTCYRRKVSNGVCKACGQQRTIHGSGLCSTCFSKKYPRRVTNCKRCGEVWQIKAYDMCTRCYSKQYADENKDKILKHMKQRRNETKLLVFSHYCGGTPKCMCPGCDVTILDFLTIDHVAGGGGAHRRELKKAGSNFYIWLLKNNYPEGYRVMCFNCNNAMGIFGYCPHVRNEPLPTL